MSGPDSPFRTELEQAIFEPKRKLVHEARTPNFPLREELMPAGVRLLGLDLVGRLPRDLILADDLKKTAKTTSETSVTLNLSTSSIRMFLQPGIIIDVSLLGVASLNNIWLVFGESEPRIELRDVGFGADPSDQIREKLMEDYGEAIRASVFARSQYDWTRDPRLFDNLTQFYQSVSDPFTPRGPFVANLKLDSLSLHAMAVREVRAGEEGAFISIVPRSSIDVTVNFQAYLDNLIDASKVSQQALADTVILNSIEIRCPLRLFHEGQQIGRIESLEIARDGQVFIRDFAIVHPKAAAAEMVINAGFVTLAVFWTLLREGLKLASLATSQTDPAALALHGGAVNQALRESLGTVLSAARDAEPDIVSNQIIKILEPVLTEKIVEVMRANLRAIPGVDLTRVFDLPNKLK